MFSISFTAKYIRFPRIHGYTEHCEEFLPNHKSEITGKFADRFIVQIPNEPAAIITSHISKDGHYFIHYDSGHYRSVTVCEAARAQTFPDNFLFVVLGLLNTIRLEILCHHFSQIKSPKS